MLGAFKGEMSSGGKKLSKLSSYLPEEGGKKRHV